MTKISNVTTFCQTKGFQRIEERVNRILKTSIVVVDGFEDETVASEAIAQSIYNRERPHLTWNMMTFEQARKQNTMILRQWKKQPRGHQAD